MSIALLQSKLNVPQPRPEAVERPRLLTAVAAPAGYGKTTLLAQWLATLAGWVALAR